MAKKKKAFNKIQWIAAYKSFLLEKGALPANAKELAEYCDKSLKEFREKFLGLEQLETAVIRLYFKEAVDLLMADESFHEYSNKEKQLAFLYVLIEKVGKDEEFLHEFIHHKKWEKTFAIKVVKMVNQQELSWASINWKNSRMANLGFNPKQSILIQHALSTIAFFLKDSSPEKQDTDAYIEKTTDVLYRLTDTSTLRSMLDLGKFLFSRRSSAFSWD